MRNDLFERSCSVKFRLAGFAFAEQTPASGGAAPSTPLRSGMSAFNVSSASASALAVAITHRIRRPGFMVAFSLPQRRLSDRRHSLHIGAWLSGNQHERATAAGPDHRLVPHEFER